MTRDSPPRGARGQPTSGGGLPRPRPPKVPADPEKPHPYDPHDLIPADAKEKAFGATTRFEHGRDYRWRDAQGREWRLHVHTADPWAPKGSNSRNGPTYRVDLKRCYVDARGRIYPENVTKPKHVEFDQSIANMTHIPWPTDVPLPWEES